ncbi:MAG: N-acetylmuramoyl-L-alanine amidase, partial [Verrucomicrobiota bacterium]
KWMVKDKQLRATNVNSRIYFEMDSLKAQFNGLSVSLSRPVVLRNGTVFISTVDLEATLHPLLFPKKMARGETIKTICLDAGHGGSDPGKIDGRMQEKRYALLLAEEVERLLKLAGFKVVQTRERDEYVEREDRPKIANQKKADLFISLHFNAADNKSVQGTEIYCLTPEGTISSNGGNSARAYRGHDQNSQNILLAYQMQKSLLRNVKTEDRGVKRAQFEVLLSLKMPGILIEGGYMTSPIESKRIYDSAYRKKLALAIVDGILSYKKIVERKSA